MKITGNLKQGKKYSKKNKKLINILVIVVYAVSVSLLLTCCSVSAITGDKSIEKLYPSFSDSNIELIDSNGGDLYPGESVDVNINVTNNGDIEARNVKVTLALSDLFLLDKGETSWDIDTLDIGEKVTFNTSLKAVDKVTEDSLASCKLKISSDETGSFISPDYKTMVYGVRPFEGNYIPIIGLHAIEDHIEIAIELYTDHFEKLCKVLKEYGYETVTFTDLLNYIDYGKALPEKPVIITSDDGFQDVYTNGFPILKKYGYKMTVFLVTGAVRDSDADRETNRYFNKRTNTIRPILIWPEIKEMDEYGCEFLSHSVNHIRLGLCSDEEFLYELIQSKKDIESHLDKEVLFFAWPYDNHSDEKLHLLSQAGYRGTVRYWGGIEDMRTIDLYDIKRVEFNSYIPPNQYASYLKLDRSIAIEYIIDEYDKKIDEEFTVEFIVKNSNKKSIEITSLELELSDNIELTGVNPDGYIGQYPGVSEGIYMWVSDSYIIEGEDEINLIVKLKGIKSEKSLIKFRATSSDNYINCNDIEIEIKD